MEITAFKQLDSYDSAIILPIRRFDSTSLFNFYESKLDKPCLYLGFNLPDKVSVGNARKHWLDNKEGMRKKGIKNIYVADVTYFKAITRVTKAADYDSKVIEQDGFSIMYGVNYGVLQHNPSAIEKLDHSIKLFNELICSGSIKVDKKYRSILKGSKKDFIWLMEKPILACDIETTTLSPYTAEIKTIAFAWSATESIAFEFVPEFKKFFEEYKGELIFHNAKFDLKMLIYNLFMASPRDLPSVRKFLQNSPKIHDTMIMAYLSKNSVDKPSLSLKELTVQEFGRYAVDVKDITQIDTETLLEYNAKDVMATYWLYEREYKPSELYEFYLDIIKTLIYTEMCGMHVDVSKTEELEKELLVQLEELESSIDTTTARQIIEERELAKINARLKVKKRDSISIPFNFNSSQHLRVLLYDVWQLPVLDKTDTGEASTAVPILKKLDDERVKKIVDRSAISKLISAFIPAFKSAYKTSEGNYITSNFSVTGTVSGRLTSSNINMQQLPSNSTYGKAVKKLFTAPKGWVFAGADFNSLESRINALVTKDPNKIKVFTENYDSHCLNTYAYWGDRMPDIENTVESINSIKDKYPELRQNSKAVTFALNYSGTWKTLHKNCGFTVAEAKAIEAKYHELYKVSDMYQENMLRNAAKNGYVELAFGLRLLTPKLKLFGYDKMKVSDEARTVNNAVTGQSYSLLTNRALNAIMKRVWASKYADDVLPACLIHDALYFYLKDSSEVIDWFNDVLVEEMSWNDLPSIKSTDVPMSAELEIFYPSWADPLSIKDFYEKKKKHRTHDQS